MSIGFYNFQKLHNSDFQSEVMTRFQEIVSQNAFVEGKYNTMFEEEFAKMQASSIHTTNQSTKLLLVSKAKCSCE